MLPSKKYNFISIIVLVNILFFSCKTKNINKSNNDQIVFQNKDVKKEIPSPDKSKTLVLEYVEKMEIPIQFSYKVIDSQTNKELISGSFSGLKMEWENNHSIRAYSYIAMVEKDNKNPQKLYELINID